MWECDLLRELANKVEKDVNARELASKLRVIAINIEDQKLTSAQQGVTIEDQMKLIWDLRSDIRMLRVERDDLRKQLNNSSPRVS